MSPGREDGPWAIFKFAIQTPYLECSAGWFGMCVWLVEIVGVPVCWWVSRLASLQAELSLVAIEDKVDQPLPDTF